MKLPGLVICTVVFATGALSQTPCLPVTGEQILGSDLARAVPGLAGIPANTPLAPTPLVGGARIFSPSELQAVGARFSITVTSPEVCFRYASEPLNRDQVLESLRNSLGIAEAQIELVEMSPGPVPLGAVQFTRENLSEPASPDQRTPVIWRGDVVYAGKRHFAIWAKVRITAPVRRWTAVEALRSGAPIRASQVRVETVDGFPAAAGHAGLSLEQITGMTALRPVARGGEIRLDNLVRPNDVNRGDLVHVEVRFGAAHLALTGRAETAGRVGETISVRNPDSSRIFQAMVEGADRVLVEPPGGERN